MREIFSHDRLHGRLAGRPGSAGTLGGAKTPHARGEGARSAQVRCVTGWLFLGCSVRRAREHAQRLHGTEVRRLPILDNG